MRTCSLELDYAGLESSMEEALAELWQAKANYDRGVPVKRARFKMYKAWAGFAGCVWPIHKVEQRFAVEGSRAHAMVKEQKPDQLL